MDLRVPSGAFFAIIGVLLIAEALFSRATAPLAGANVNSYSGAAMLAFGLTMLALARFGRRSDQA